MADHAWGLTIVTGDIETQDEADLLNELGQRFWTATLDNKLTHRSTHGTNDTISYFAEGEPAADHLATLQLIAAERAPRWWRVGRVTQLPPRRTT